MPITERIRLIDSEDFFNKYNHKASLCLLCKIISVATFCPCINKDKYADGKKTGSFEIHVSAMARNYFQNFPVEFIYSCNEVNSPQRQSVFYDFARSGSLVVADTSVYYLIDGDLTLFAPALTLVTGIPATHNFDTI